MADKGHSEPNFFGGYTHYDEKGNKIGTSEPSFFGGFTDYDAKGNKIGTTEENFFGGYTHYDSHNQKIGTSEPGLFDDYSHYDGDGQKIGSSSPTFSGGYSHTNNKEGCYIATCVYGSYESPEVLTLRRFRDGVLKRSAAGRLLIRAYYAVSPRLVAVFGENRLIRAFWKQGLDAFVRRLTDPERK